MINEAELLTWLDSAKRAAKIPPIIPEGKYTMVVEVVPLLAKIRELTGISEGGDTVDAKTAEKGQ